MNTIASRAALRSEPINSSLEQLADGLASNHLITDALDAEQGKDVPALLEIPTSADTEKIHLHNGSYVQLAIHLLATCAEDLVLTEKILSNPHVSTRKRNSAQRLQDATIKWLRKEPPQEEIQRPLLTFNDCVMLLEDELRLQSLNLVDVPEIVNRSDELAEWIIGDPHEAKRLLNGYLKIFGWDPENFDSENEDEESDTGYTQTAARPRC